jgi:hypothetical protein
VAFLEESVVTSKHCTGAAPSASGYLAGVDGTSHLASTPRVADDARLRRAQALAEHVSTWAALGYLAGVETRSARAT